MNEAAVERHVTHVSYTPGQTDRCDKMTVELLDNDFTGQWALCTEILFVIVAAVERHVTHVALCRCKTTKEQVNTKNVLATVLNFPSLISITMYTEQCLYLIYQ